jgi:hypothetical protein
MSSCRNHTNFPFLALPAEIQVDIFRNLLCCSVPIALFTPKVPKSLKKSSTGGSPKTKSKFELLAVPLSSQVLRVCRPFHQEGTRILYGHNTFGYGSHSSDSTMCRSLPVTAASVGMIRKLEFQSLKYLAQFQRSFSRFHSLQRIDVDVNIRMGPRASMSDISEDDFKKIVDAKLRRYPQYENALTGLPMNKGEVNVGLMVRPWCFFEDLLKPVVSWHGVIMG